MIVHSTQGLRAANGRALLNEIFIREEEELRDAYYEDIDRYHLTQDLKRLRL